MDFSLSPRSTELCERVGAFIRTEIVPVERDYERDLAAARVKGLQWRPLPVLAELQAKARGQGLWNLFLPAGHENVIAPRYLPPGGAGLSNVDYAPVAERTGHSFLAPLAFNCNAPDSGNMEVLIKYGSAQQREEWLEPLLDGRIRSAFAMTEPGVASSDATTM